jgi:hypothetical protein
LGRESSSRNHIRGACGWSRLERTLAVRRRS